MADMTLEQWEHTVAVNLTSNFMLAKAYLRNLRTQTDEQKSVASIISLGSTAGKYGEANHADYASAKSGKFFLTETFFFINNWNDLSHDVWIHALA